MWGCMFDGLAIKGLTAAAPCRSGRYLHSLFGSLLLRDSGIQLLLSLLLLLLLLELFHYYADQRILECYSDLFNSFFLSLSFCFF